MDNEKLLLTLKNIYNVLYELSRNSGNYSTPLLERLIRLSENINDLEKGQHPTE